LAVVSGAPGIRTRLGVRWQRFERWVGAPGSAVALFAVALAAFALESLFLPAYPGRDMTRYLQAFVQLGYDQPILPAVINTRGPLASLGVGLPLELGGWAAEVWLACLYALSIVAWAAVALVFGARAAVFTAAALLVYPGYGILFHELASDSLFAAGFAGWALLLSRAVLRPSVKSFLAVGFGLGLLVLIRPPNQVLIVMALLPLFLRAPWSRRLAWVAAFFVPAAAVTQGWKALNQLRYGDAVALRPSGAVLVAALVLLPFLVRPPWRRRLAVVAVVAVVAGVAVKKGAEVGSPVEHVGAAVQAPSAGVFLFRAFAADRIVSPDNGPASRQLARVVRRELLAKEPYRSYGVTLDDVFSSGSNRVLGDIQGLSGVDLSAVTREAIRRHPGVFSGGIARTIWQELWRERMYAPLDSASEGPGADELQGSAGSGQELPPPSDDEPIPASRFGPQLLTLGGPAQEVWRSPTEHSFVFSDPRDERRYEKFGQATARLAERIPTRAAHEGLVHRLNQASRAFPPPIVWIVLGLVALAVRRPRHALVALAPAAAGLVVIAATSFVVFAVAQYAAPVSPAFVLLAGAGLLAPRGERARASPTLAAASRVAIALAALAAAAWAAKRYVDNVDYRISVGEAPHDLAVFLKAAAAVVHGASPYAFRADETYAYPPLLAFLMTPFDAVGVSAATVLWTVLSLAAVGAALWLLGVRDWRCYCLAAVYPMTRSAVVLGTVGPLLLLAVAVAWRWRDRVLVPAAATGAAIALKLFLWPLLLWLALTRRLEAAVAAAALALALVFVPWLAIGADGLVDYPDLLRKLSDQEATASYSVQALGVRAHLPETAATIVSLLVAAALLAAATYAARDARRTPRDRDVAALTLVLAAALAVSPIVWIHYFLLLLVPIALTRPRLSWLWLVPLAYWPLGESGWPGGDARKLALALATTLVVIVATARRGAGDPGRVKAGSVTRSRVPVRASRTP
jgi:Glycosyltransferase family 87/Dolichyl-phosphate-mannose-protein mannosyltransferase